MMLPIVFSAFLCAVLIYIIWIDFRYFIIPDLANATLLLVGVVQAFVLQQREFFDLLTSVVLAFAFTWAMRWAYFRIRGQEGLGFGDVKFMAAAGAWLAIELVPLMLFVSCVFALGYVVVMQLFKTEITISSRIAFGPHLALGLGVTWGVEQFWR
jgi:leader peptidase (prepilin peptidase) / N-methyltransferase